MAQNVYGPDYIQVTGLNVSGTTLSGQITCTGIGTAVQGSNIALSNGAFLKALPSNTGTVYVGLSGGSISGTTGYPLLANEQIIVQITNLNTVWFDGIVTDKVAWLKG